MIFCFINTTKTKSENKRLRKDNKGFYHSKLKIVSEKLVREKKLENLCIGCTIFFVFMNIQRKIK